MSRTRNTKREPELADVDVFYKALEPLVRAFTQKLALLGAAHVAELRARADEARRRFVISALEAEDGEGEEAATEREDAGEGDRRRLPGRRAEPAGADVRVESRALAPRPPDRGPAPARAAKPAKGARAPRSCSKCGEPGRRSDTCGITHNVGGKSKSSSDDAEEEREVVQVAAPKFEVMQVPPPTRALPALPSSRPLPAPAKRPFVLPDLHKRREPRVTVPPSGPRVDPQERGEAGGAGHRREGGDGDPEAFSSTRGRLAQPVVADDTSSADATSPPSTSPPSTSPPSNLIRIVRRRRRVREEPRSMSVSEKANAHIAASHAERMLGLEDGGVFMTDEIAELEAQRPKVRGDCLPGGINEARPCPWLSCKYHLAIDITPAGSLQLIREKPLEELADTCVLDVADRAEAAPIQADELGRFKNPRFAMTLDEVGETLNVTRERIRQIEAKALIAAKASARYYGIGEDDAEFDHPTYGEDDYR